LESESFVQHVPCGQQIKTLYIEPGYPWQNGDL